MTPRVFICNDNGLDFSKAEKYGNLYPLTRGPVDVFKPHATKKEIDDQLERMKFDPLHDYVLLAGANLAVGFVFSWLTLCGSSEGQEDSFPNIKLLIFHAKENDYMIRTVKL